VVRPQSELLRFVIGPGDRLVPDISRRLPGRGLWLTAQRDIVAAAAAKRLFARAARASVVVEDGLVERVEALLAQRCCDLIGLARRAGEAVPGFDKVRGALVSGKAALLLAAADGAAGGRDKLKALAPGLPLIELLSAAELGAAFGREHVVHAALRPGRLATALRLEAVRLAGLRPQAPGGPETGRGAPERDDGNERAGRGRSPPAHGE
jgi:predicted RNA-binding protein YlxR (DUF448 family)